MTKSNTGFCAVRFISGGHFTAQNNPKVYKDTRGNQRSLTDNTAVDNRVKLTVLEIKVVKSVQWM